MSFVQVKDIKMHYQIYKSQYAMDTLVLIHGVGLSMELWEPILPYFLHNYHVVIFDLRGHGETERGTSDFSWELFVDDINKLMNLLHLESFHLIGHGLGATLTMKYSQKYKEKVKNIILLAVPAFFPRKSIDALIESRKVLSRSGSMLPLAQNMAKGITMEPSDSSIFQKIVNAYSMVTPETYFQIFDLYLDTPPNGDFEFITHPTLSLVGVHDPIYLTSYTLSSKLLIQTRLLVVPHSSNAVFIDQPKLTAEWIHDFIQKPVLVRSNYGSFESNGAVSVMDYFHEVYEIGINKLGKQTIIQVDFLTAFRVSINNEYIWDGWNQRYAKSLLLFLTFNQTTSREQICDSLFPEVPLKQALNNLKVYLNYLRKLIEIDESNNSILMTDKEHVAIRGSLRSDVLKLNSDLQKAQIEKSNDFKLNLCKEIFNSLPETLLPGLYDDWINLYRDKLENQIVDLAKEVAEIERDRGNLQSSIYFYNVALRYHPEDEWLYDETILLYEQLKNGVERQKGNRVRKEKMGRS
ncbi:pimeloyl-ACP methyl ester carboxylesterase [Paenibacillus pabuli]|uniref:Pimeloyl-ACP methyl ester carboxylesterase n=1 Tax=Paenibacillus pabuli TaxID=1472 RepID=A0ABX9BKL2_9BACL|nr:alpha/beta hydrolase [Paenibacillus pabuli]RAI97060.1 pimeloyl-ACP methyl ester carboxylesterase [Paenibacillus pabuli]